MVFDDEKDKSFDQISELLKKHYKPDKHTDENQLVTDILDKIDSLFHKEILSEKIADEKGELLSDEERYWTGLNDYINNKMSALKHKQITEHLLKCNACRKNHSESLDKKKDKFLFNELIISKSSLINLV